jgi:hypothetical protein
MQNVFCRSGDTYEWTPGDAVPGVDIDDRADRLRSRFVCGIERPSGNVRSTR